MALPERLSGAIHLIRRAPSLWPGFAPQDIPLLVFDGRATWLMGAPPHGPGWQSDVGGWRWPGRHPALTANTAVTLEGGTVAAGVLLPTLGNVEAPALASVLVHEAFHVYQHAVPSPAWDANELDALTYPATDETVLHARAEETCWLSAALSGADWALSVRRALSWRRVRHARLHPEHRTFEERIETAEGLAEYVETRFLNMVPVLDAGQAASLTARQWGYHSGAALGHLLDRAGTDWTARVLGGTPLAGLLAEVVGDTDGLPVPDPDLRDSARVAAELKTTQGTEAEHSFQNQPGDRLTLVSSQGLQVTGFDPMNVLPLGDGRMLHRRLLHLRLPESGVLRVTGGQAIAQGPTPVRVTFLDLRGLPTPVINDGLWSVQDDRRQITLPSAHVQRTEDGWTCELD